MLLGVLAVPLAATELDESFTFESRSLSLGNLIGEIEVEGHSGDAFEVDVRVRGRDATRDALRFETRRGTNGRLSIRFPVDEHRRFVYPELGRRGSVSLQRPEDDRDGLLAEILAAFSRDRIRVSASGPGVELWADVTVRVPTGASLEVDHGVGKVRLRRVEGSLDVEISSGSVEGEDVTGELAVDTGSGSVELARVRGRLAVDTGSGRVELADYDGPGLEIDTGSGSVEATSIHSRSLVIDTGSGGVRAERVRCDDALIDTGSGSVVLALDELGPGDIDVATGSGSITLLVPGSVSAEVRADTGSGGIDVDLPEVSTFSRGRNEVHFRVGEGRSRVRLDTGSGSIRIAQAAP
jgi:hypothetical protein